ncbi:MAG: universal stress protein [Candidatus Hydrogenedentes bacterium]|nr:universal stress protein [Candidatus Hydrogenedentota bacterium]MBI3118794.1 universal stress protein [Candidatus Hydrogenedentota bacterium]
MYTNILIPLENSLADETILQHIRPLARMTNAHILLVHVADGFMAQNQEWFDVSPEMREDRDYLGRRSAELQNEGFTVEAQLACGNPAAEILRLAEEKGCDLIAMATHGHRLLADMILGSVASQVRHQARIPVLQLRAQDKDAPAETR